MFIFLIIICILCGIIQIILDFKKKKRNEEIEIKYKEDIQFENKYVNKNEEIEIKYKEDIQFENKYVNKIEDLFNKYQDLCCDVNDFFSYNFADEDKKTYTQRINILRKTIEKYQELKDFCFSLGELGIEEFNSYHSDKNFKKIPFKFYDNFDYAQIDENYVYISPYENCDFENINFLNYLLDQYSENKEQAIEFIKADKKAYEIDYYGGIENYTKGKQREEFIKKSPKELINLIKANEGILQKDIYSHFPEEFKSEVYKILISLVEKDKIERIKAGRTYKLFIKNKAISSINSQK